jgi:cold shock CspA family protein
VRRITALRAMAAGSAWCSSGPAAYFTGVKMSDITVTANGIVKTAVPVNPANTVSATASIGGGRLTGKVVMWSERGFGFVRRDNGKGDLFFHCKDVRGGSAAVGERVEFSIGEGRKGKPAAFEVTIVE